MRISILGISMLLAGQLAAQSLPTMVPVEGGSFSMGGGYQYYVEGYKMRMIGNDATFSKTNSEDPAIGEIPSFNNPSRSVALSDFWIAETEISNLQFRHFLMDSLLNEQERKKLQEDLRLLRKGKIKDPNNEILSDLFSKAEEKNLMPDQHVWETDFQHAYSEPLVKYYFTHPAYDDYPVVGVTWHQANAYCGWLTRKMKEKNGTRASSPKMVYRLPSEAEWEYAADRNFQLGSSQTNPVLGDLDHSSILSFGQGFSMNTKVMPGNYYLDGYEFTNPLKAFPAGKIKLHGMGGNVSEWTADDFSLRDQLDFEFGFDLNPSYPDSSASSEAKSQEGRFGGHKVIKGGSWADYIYAAIPGSRAPMDGKKGHSRVGFRVAASEEAK